MPIIFQPIYGVPSLLLFITSSRASVNHSSSPEVLPLSRFSHRAASCVSTRHHLPIHHRRFAAVHFTRREFSTALHFCLGVNPTELGRSPLLLRFRREPRLEVSSNVDAAIPLSIDKNGEEETEEFDEYLAEDGEVYQKTLRLVECAMFAAVSGLAFLLSNSLAIEKYFACFFALPIVLSTMRWGITAGRKTMVATVVLLFVLSGPVKAVTYMLLHGLPGFAMGTFWRYKASWGTSVLLCSIVRAIGALGNVVIVSYLIGENILALITINAHAGVTYLLASMGFIAVPTMNFIYFIFGVLLMLNCGFYVFLLHLLYDVFFTKLGMKASLRRPKWLETVTS